MRSAYARAFSLEAHFSRFARLPRTQVLSDRFLFILRDQNVHTNTHTSCWRILSSLTTSVVNAYARLYGYTVCIILLYSIYLHERARNIHSVSGNVKQYNIILCAFVFFLTKYRFYYYYCFVFFLFQATFVTSSPRERYSEEKKYFRGTHVIWSCHM